MAVGSWLTSSDTCSEGVSTTGNCSEMRCLCGNVPLLRKSEGFIPSIPSLAFLCTQKLLVSQCIRDHPPQAAANGIGMSCAY